MRKRYYSVFLKDSVICVNKEMLDILFVFERLIDGSFVNEFNEYCV